MLKKLMASLGVGSAKVNLILDREQYRIGETVKGRVLLDGGSVDQEINTLDVDVVMKFNIKGKEFTKVADTVKVARNFQVRAKATQETPFEYRLPFSYPISKGPVAYYFTTKMDIAKAVDTGDLDKFVVLPGKDMALILEALDYLGFREKIGSGKLGRFGQEFDYYPTAIFENKLKELDVKFFMEEQGLKMFLELKIASGYMVPAKHYTELAVSGELLAGGSVEQVSGFISDFLKKELDIVSTQGPITMPSYLNYQNSHRGHGHKGSPFGGFMGGMVAGLLGAAMLGSLFDGDENADEEGADTDTGGGEGVDDGELDFDMGE